MVKLIDDSEKSSVIAKELPKTPNIADQVFPNETPWDEIINPKTKKKKDLPDHITRILCIMWLNSHTRASRSKVHSTETELKILLEQWLEDHPV